jgi:DNA-binding PadR family transcriptional regulator
LRAAFQALAGGEGNWDVKPAQIYTTLARLGRGGLVVEDGVEQDADPGRELAGILLLDRAIMHVEADLRWLDMIEARLDEVRRQPLPEPETKTRGRPRKTWALPS